MADAKVKAIFNAARRYCVDRIGPLESKRLLYDAARMAEQNLVSDSYPWEQRVRQAPPLDQLPPLSAQEQARDEATASILGAILEEIDRRIADNFRDVTEALAYLMTAGQRAKVLNYQASSKGGEVQVRYFEPEWTSDDIAARDEARTSYLNYVTRVSPEEAVGIPTVPYRYVMSESKRRNVGRKLAKRWHVDPFHHYWYPLWNDETPADVLAVQDWYFQKEVGAARLQEILFRHGITRVWQITEMRLPPEFELDPSLVEFSGSGSEVYWSSRELSWLVYASHEASITFAGKWLVNELKRVWPTWEQRVYTSYYYERSLS